MSADTEFSLSRTMMAVISRARPRAASLSPISRSRISREVEQSLALAMTWLLLVDQEHAAAGRGVGSTSQEGRSILLARTCRVASLARKRPIWILLAKGAIFSAAASLLQPRSHRTPRDPRRRALVGISLERPRAWSRRANGLASGTCARQGTAPGR